MFLFFHLLSVSKLKYSKLSEICRSKDDRKISRFSVVVRKQKSLTKLLLATKLRKIENSGLKV